MLAHSKIALIALALVLSCSAVRAQDDPPGPPPGGPGMSDDTGRGSMGPGGPMRGRGNWDRGRDRFDGENRMNMRGPGGGREFGLSRLLSDPAIREQLGVSADQFAKIRQQESAFQKSAIRDRADIGVKRIDLSDLLAADTPDRAAIDSKLQEISASRLTFEKSAIAYRLDSRSALTQAQRDKLRQIMQDRRQQRGGPGSRGARGASRGGQRGTPPPAQPQGQTPPSQ